MLNIQYSDSIKNQVILLTGGAQGIGFGIAQEFAKMDTKIIVSDINKKKLESRIKNINVKKNSFIETIVLDVTDEDKVNTEIDMIMNKYGKIDLLINNAGLLTVSRTVDMQLTEWEKVIQTNLTGVFIMSKAVAKHMIKNKYGSIISISSIGGKIGGEGISHYCASKFGVIGFTQSLAMELSKFNITVNAICPGLVKTTMMKKLADDSGKSIKMFQNKQLINSPQTPNDIAKSIMFLHSMRNITGQAINVDGGTVFH